MRRLLHLFFALAAFTCFFACLYGIWWLWEIKKPAIDTTTKAFDSVEQWLGVADDTITDVQKNLARARQQAEIVEKNSASVNSATGANQPGMMQDLQMTMARVAVRQMTPNVNEVQRTVDKVTEASIVVNSILDSIQDVPLESVEKLDTDQIAKLRQQIGGVSRASSELGDFLYDVQPSDGESPAAKSARIAANLSHIIAMTNDFQQRVNALRKRIAHIRGETLYWMNLTPTLGTIALSWIAISQLVVLMVVVKAGRASAA
jgi:hypothetical protein